MSFLWTPGKECKTLDMERQQNNRTKIRGRKIMDEQNIVADSEAVSLDEILGFERGREKEKGLDGHEK